MTELKRIKPSFDPETLTFTYKIPKDARPHFSVSAEFIDLDSNNPFTLESNFFQNILKETTITDSKGNIIDACLEKTDKN